MEVEKKVLYPGLAGEMAKRGHTYAHLGQLLDLSESSISRRFAGEVPWTINEVRLICEFYAKGYHELFT